MNAMINDVLHNTIYFFLDNVGEIHESKTLRSETTTLRVFRPQALDLRHIELIRIPTILH